ncbi:hypothetical protein [Cellulomonas persica]|uniref:Uncharacterized protein n=1 Tax=Cellulomonas persica TaxID=76861 RepID=A0A510URS6_9CELL|nr:hypothetical protein [Cellulomonas persica]GEK17299.1 hypothetical protein CPE01_10320 [Cellulomonas persica]
MTRGIPLAWCLAAYPPRWRALRAREVAEFLAEAQAVASQPGDPAPGAGPRVSVREAAGLVRGGIATRLRTGPPLRTRAAYRMLDSRVPARYRGWVHDERSTVLGALGEWMWSAVAFGAAAAVTRVPTLAMMALVMLPVVLVRRSLHGARHRAKHLVRQPDEPPTAWDLGWGWGPRPRLAARAALTWVLVGGVVATAAAVTVVLVAPGHYDVRGCGQACVEATAVPPGGLGPAGGAALAVAALVGAVLAGVGTRHLRAGAPALPEQPHRVVVRSGLTAALVVLLIVLPVLAVLGLELTSAPAFAYLVAAGGLVVLPVLAVARAALRTRGPRPDAVALVDVVALLRGRAPDVDAPRGCAVAGPWSAAPDGGPWSAAPDGGPGQPDPR